MKPLSKKKRRGYFIVLLFIFIIGAPLFILDAKGYRLDWSGVLKISQTGGLSIITDQSGIEIYVNHVLETKTSIFHKIVVVQGLKPGMYEINVSKEGLQSWNKTLKVFPEVVTEARSFLMKSNPELLEIPKLLTQSLGATTSPRKISLKNPDFDAVNTLFLPLVVKTPPIKSATTSPNVKMLGDLLIKNDDGKLRALWTGGADSIPSYFCENITCKSEVVISAPSLVLSFDFFPGREDLLILRTENGIYVSEVDDRSPQNIQKIISGQGYDFRIKDGKIYLKKDGSVYSVSL